MPDYVSVPLPPEHLAWLAQAEAVIAVIDQLGPLIEQAGAVLDALDQADE